MDKMMLKLLEQSRKINEKISDYKKLCPHPPAFVNYEYESNTGNYDRNDSYWTNYYCRKCGKLWHVEGSKRIEGGTDVTYKGKLVPDND